MISERDLQISPLVPDSIMHNTKTLSTLHNITASLIGVAAGILGLESYPGFIFYILFSLLISFLVYIFRIRPSASISASTPVLGTNGKATSISGRALYFRGAAEFWAGGLMEGMAGFVLTWTLFYGLVRA